MAREWHLSQALREEGGGTREGDVGSPSQMEEVGGWASQPRPGGKWEVRLESEGRWASMISSGG